MTPKDEALKLAREALEESLYATTAKSQFLAFEAITAIKQALAAPVQEPVLKHLSKKWKWVLHDSFADVAGFDEEGFPLFYWKESVTKFKSGALSTPCKGKNCGSLNGWLHSAECRAEHEALYTTPPAAQRQWVGLTNDEREEVMRVSGKVMGKPLARAIEAKIKEKNT